MLKQLIIIMFTVTVIPYCSALTVVLCEGCYFYTDGHYVTPTGLPLNMVYVRSMHIGKHVTVRCISLDIAFDNMIHYVRVISSHFSTQHAVGSAW